MIRFKTFLNEVWENRIAQSSKESSVASNTKYNSANLFKKDAKKVGEVGDMHLYSSKNSHFTWNPKDRLIHHVVHAAEKSKTENGKNRYKFLSAHSRKGSPVKMSQVYSHLVKNHNAEFVATGHSPGAKKMWNKFKNDPDLKVTHENGKEVGKNENVYAAHNTKDPAQKEIGRKSIILTKNTDNS